MARLSLAVLGPLDARLNGQPITGLAYDKVWALLAYLAVEADRPHRRDALIGLLWPDQPDHAARTNLRQALTQLRQAIGDHTAQPPFLLIARETIQFNRASDHDLDVTPFEALLAACDSHPHRHSDTCTACARRRRDAAALYRGSFLDEFFLDGAAAFEEWTLLKRETLHHRALDTLARLADYHEWRGAYEDVYRYAQRQLELDSWNEAAHRQMMRAFALTGQRSAALHQYEMCRRVLADALGVAPEAETTALYERIKCGEGPAAGSVERPATNLPAHMPLTACIGREAELAQLAERLEQRDCRLLTLVGPGGIGKTRLAQQVAAELRDSFSDGVWFVSLAAISDPALVVPSIAQTLGITEAPSQPLSAHLKRYLGAKQLLLVLDNFEQVVEAGPLVAQLLASAPELTLLITSRAVLHLSGEQEFPVPPLALPDRRSLPALDQLTEYAAVRLFSERAQAVKPGFAVTTENAAAVTEICTRLDGLPLAIELGAARIKLFPPAVLLERLHRCLPLLTGGARDLPMRQQTLRNTIDWSYHLLEAGEQMLFAHLGVFVGGCTIEAVEAVCKTERNLPLNTVDGLAALLDKSLLRQEEGPGGEPRFLMLETIREYALERLTANGENELIRQRHAAYFLALAQAAEPQLHKPEQALWLARLEAEHDNLRAVLKWALDTLEIEMGLRLAGALGWFWHVHDHFSEGRSWLARLLTLAASHGVARGVRVKALGAAGTLAIKQGDLAVAVELLEASLTLAREEEDKPGSAYALGVLGWHAVTQNDYAHAVVLSEQSLRLYRDIGDKWGIAQALWNLGRVMDIQGNDEQATAYLDECLRVWQEAGDTRGIATVLNQQGLLAQHQGNYDRARLLFEQSLLLYRELTETWGTARARFHLARVAQYQGDYGQAAVVLEESLALFQKLGDKEHRALSLIALGNIAFEQGDYERTLALGEESLRLCWELGNKEGIAMSLEGLAAVAGVRGQPERAARLLGAEAALRDEIGYKIMPTARGGHERTIATARAALGEEVFAASWAAGRAMPLEQAIACAIESRHAAPEVAAGAPSSRQYSARAVTGMPTSPDLPHR